MTQAGPEKSAWYITYLFSASVGSFGKNAPATKAVLISRGQKFILILQVYTLGQGLKAPMQNFTLYFVEDNYFGRV